MAREVAEGVEAREKVKKVTGRYIPSQTIVHLGPNTHVFNGSDHNVYVEVVDDNGELRIRPPGIDAATLVIKFGAEY